MTTYRRFFFFQKQNKKTERSTQHDTSNLRQRRPSGIRCCHHPLPHSLEAYGRYLFRNAGHFAYDPDLEDFYDYEKCGLQQMAQEKGCFTEQGYLSCQGEQSLEELLWEAKEGQKPAEPEMQMGGW